MAGGETNLCVIESRGIAIWSSHIQRAFNFSAHQPTSFGAPTPLAASPQTILVAGCLRCSIRMWRGLLPSSIGLKSTLLSQMARTPLDRQGQVPAPWESYCSSISASRQSKRSMQLSVIRRRRDSPADQSLNENHCVLSRIVRTRFSNRKPQSYMYAPFSPVLHYNALQGDFVGGEFLDMRASGYRLQESQRGTSAGPPTNPVEMGLPDSSCIASAFSHAPFGQLLRVGCGRGLVYHSLLNPM